MLLCFNLVFTLPRGFMQQQQQKSMCCEQYCIVCFCSRSKRAIYSAIIEICTATSAAGCVSYYKWLISFICTVAVAKFQTPIWHRVITGYSVITGYTGGLWCSLHMLIYTANHIICMKIINIKTFFIIILYYLVAFSLFFDTSQYKVTNNMGAKNRAWHVTTTLSQTDDIVVTWYTSYTTGSPRSSMWSGLAWFVMHINANESWQDSSGYSRPRQQALYRKVHGGKRACHFVMKDASFIWEDVSSLHIAEIVKKG